MTISTTIAEYSPTAAALAEIGTRMAKVVYDVSTSAGMTMAKKDRAEIRDLRVALEKKRVEIKEPALTRCREIDTEAKRITAELLKFETPPDEAIKREEKRIADIQAAKAAAEEKRKADIRERIAELGGNTMLTPTSDAKLIAGHIADLEAIKVDESFAEFFGDAEEAKKFGLAKLRTLYAAAVAHETESARILAERAELDRQRAEQAERDKEERRRIDEEERATHAKRDAETAAENERLRKAREAFDAEQAEARETARKEAARVAAEQAAAQKVIDDARRELEARQKAEKEARESAERKAVAEAEERARQNYRPHFEDIVDVVAAYYKVDAATVCKWIEPVT